ncbi:MAG: hypothetical protein RLY86_1320 [Pseudomonadota bacterium]
MVRHPGCGVVDREWNWEGAGPGMRDGGEGLEKRPRKRRGPVRPRGVPPASRTQEDRAGDAGAGDGSPAVAVTGGGRADPRTREAIDLARFLPFRFATIYAKMADDAVRHPEVYHGISMRAWKVLALLAPFPDSTNAEISAINGMDPATATRAVAELKAAGLVTTRRDRVDRRRMLNRLTDAGAALHDRIAPGRRARGQSFEAAFTAAELDQLHRLLDKLDAHVDAIFQADRRREVGAI